MSRNIRHPEGCLWKNNNNNNISSFQISPSSQNEILDFVENYSTPIWTFCPTSAKNPSSEFHEEVKNPIPEFHEEKKPMFQCYVCQAIFEENSYQKKYDAGVFNEKQRFQCNRCWERANIFIEHTPAPLLDTSAPLLDTPSPLLDTLAPLLDTPESLLDTPAPLLDISAPLLDTPESLLDTPVPFLDTPAPLLNTPAPLLDTPVPLFDTPVLNLAPNLAPAPALLVHRVPDRFCDIRRRGD